jgi:hypothetical protein
MLVPYTTVAGPWNTYTPSPYLHQESENNGRTQHFYPCEELEFRVNKEADSSTISYLVLHWEKKKWAHSIRCALVTFPKYWTVMQIQ